METGAVLDPKVVSKARRAHFLSQVLLALYGIPVCLAVDGYGLAIVNVIAAQ